MDRKYESGAAGSPPSAPGSPSAGYPTAGDPGSATPATKPGPYWFHMITEELYQLVIAAGLTPAFGTLTQVRDAVLALISSAIGWSTGDVKLTLKTAADSGWIMCNDGTIGDASSGATYANSNAQALFTLIYTNVSDTWAPVTGGRGASAAADWAAHKKIALTKMLGRALAIGGAGSGLTSRALGQNLGEEAHVQTSSEMAVHGHGVSDPGHVHSIDGGAGNFVTTQTGGTNNPVTGSTLSTPNTDTAATGLTVSNAGSAAAANVMQPTSFLNAMIKL